MTHDRPAASDVPHVSRTRHRRIPCKTGNYQDQVQITTAMNLLHAGVDITVIALWLGHESPTTTRIYLKARELHQAGGKPQVTRSTLRQTGVSGECATAA